MQTETVMNTLLLTPLSTDVNDLQPQTLGHFLICGLLLNIPENRAVVDLFTFFF